MDSSSENNNNNENEKKRKKSPLEEEEEEKEKETEMQRRRNLFTEKYDELLCEGVKFSCLNPNAKFAVITFSPDGEIHSFGNTSTELLVDRFLQSNNNNNDRNSTAEIENPVVVDDDDDDEEEDEEKQLIQETRDGRFWWESLDPSKCKTLEEVQIMTKILENEKAKALRILSSRNSSSSVTVGVVDANRVASEAKDDKIDDKMKEFIASSGSGTIAVAGTAESQKQPKKKSGER